MFLFDNFFSHLSRGFFILYNDYRMRQVLIVTDTKLPNIVFPQNYENYILTFRHLTEDQVEKEIKFNTCRAFIGKKEIINFFNLNSKVQIVNVKEYKLKPYDKILLRVNEKYFIIELLETKKYYKLLKKLKWI